MTVRFVHTPLDASHCYVAVGLLRCRAAQHSIRCDFRCFRNV